MRGICELGTPLPAWPLAGTSCWIILASTTFSSLHPEPCQLGEGGLYVKDTRIMEVFFVNLKIMYLHFKIEMVFTTAGSLPRVAL